MELNNTFVWYDPEWIRSEKELLGRRDEVSMAKIKAKIPMCQKVITEDNEIWSYCVIDGKLMWMYEYSCFEK